MRNRLIEKIYEQARIDKDIVLLTGDLGFGVLDKFAKELPNQFINMGIAEQNMMSVASALGIEGKKVFVYSIGNFPTLRCFEQIRNDCCYHNSDVKIICAGSGVSYGALGMSHHTTEDIAIMRALPNMQVFAPASKKEVDAITPIIFSEKCPAYIRLGKGGEAECHDNIVNYQLGDYLKINDGKKVVIITVGAIVENCIKANESLRLHGMNATIITLPCIKPINETKLQTLLGEYDFVVTVEEHTIIGGLGGMLAELMADNGIDAKLIRIGFNDLYTSKIGSRDYILEEYGLGADKIAKRIIQSVGLINDNMI